MAASLAPSLPYDVLVLIFEQVGLLDAPHDSSGEELVMLSNVCRSWREASCYPPLWRRVRVTDLSCLFAVLARGGRHVRSLMLDTSGVENDADDDIVSHAVSTMTGLLEALILPGHLIGAAFAPAVWRGNPHLADFRLLRPDKSPRQNELTLALPVLCSGLQSLNLSFARISDASLGNLAALVTLRHLRLRQCSALTSATVARLATSCPQLATLDVRGCWRLDDTALLALREGLCRASLTHMDFREVPSVTAAALCQLLTACSQPPHFVACTEMLTMHTATSYDLTFDHGWCFERKIS